MVGETGFLLLQELNLGFCLLDGVGVRTFEQLIGGVLALGGLAVEHSLYL